MSDMAAGYGPNSARFSTSTTKVGGAGLLEMIHVKWSPPVVGRAGAGRAAGRRGDRAAERAPKGGHTMMTLGPGRWQAAQTTTSSNGLQRGARLWGQHPTG